MPELPGPDSHAIAMAQARYESLAADFMSQEDASWPADWEPTKDFSENLKRNMEDAQIEIYNKAVEHLKVFDTAGNNVVSEIGETDRVGFDPSRLPKNGIALHNHPTPNMPPSLEDAVALFRNQFILVRIVTSNRIIFDLGPKTAKLGDFVFFYKTLDDQSWAVAEECIRKEGLEISEIERFCRRQHAIFLEMARLGNVCYRRYTWKMSLENPKNK